MREGKGVSERRGGTAASPRPCAVLTSWKLVAGSAPCQVPSVSMICSTSLILSFVLSRELTLGMCRIVVSSGFSAFRMSSAQETASPRFPVHRPSIPRDLAIFRIVLQAAFNQCGGASFGREIVGGTASGGHPVTLLIVKAMAHSKGFEPLASAFGAI